MSAELRARIAAAWPDLLARIADGNEIGESLKAAGLTQSHVRTYRALVPGADVEWQQARADSAASLFAELRRIASERPEDNVEATHQRTRLDTLRWMITKLDPKNYSDKAQLDVNVRTVDLTRIIEAANARLLAQTRVPIVIEQAPMAGLPAASLARARVRDSHDTLDAELVPALADLL